MTETPIGDDLGGESERPSFRCSEWLLDYVVEFQDDYNRVLEDALDETEYERLMLDSRSDALRRLIDMGLGAFYSQSVVRFAAPPEMNLCRECGANGPRVRVGIRAGETVPDEMGFDYESRLCLACGADESLLISESEQATAEADDNVGFDGVEDSV